MGVWTRGEQRTDYSGGLGGRQDDCGLRIADFGLEGLAPNRMVPEGGPNRPPGMRSFNPQSEIRIPQLPYCPFLSLSASDGSMSGMAAMRAATASTS